ncbi:MAG: glycosyltransferase family 39 protein [Candidatus Micrarchaeota archaeon]|nr:glycosyltransferase family 39 protein [Candidatus Micrarchaeota archaeon]
MERRAGKDFAEKYQYHILALVLLAGAALSILFFKGISVYGDDFDYPMYVPGILNGTFMQDYSIFSLRLAMVFPLAFFIKIFGYNNVGAGAYTFICYLLSIVLLFVFGRRLYDARAGLFGALMFAVYPLSLEYSTNDSPMMPMVLFTGLSLLLFMYAREGKGIKFYVLSGMMTFLAYLANPLALIYVLLIAAYIALITVRSLSDGRGVDYRPFLYLLGLATAVNLLGVLNLSASVQHDPYFGISLTNYYYRAAGAPFEIYYTDPSLNFYLRGYFPYGFSRALLGMLNLDPAGAAGSMSGILKSMFSLHSLNVNDVGLFGYAAALSGVPLLLKRDRRSYFALAWAAFIVLYMEFGSMSITHYFPIYKLMRFTTLAALPEMLVLGIALSRLSRFRVNGARLGMMAAALAIALLVATSLPLDYYIYLYNYNTMLYPRVMAQEIMSIPGIHGRIVYAPALIPFYLEYYTGYPKDIAFIEYGSGVYGTVPIESCSGLYNNTYVVVPSGSALRLINSFNLWTVDEPWAFDPSLCGLQLYKDVYSAVGNRSIVDLQNSGNIYYKP